MDLSPRTKAAQTVGERLAAHLRSERQRAVEHDAILERDSEDEGGGLGVPLPRLFFCFRRACLASFFLHMLA
jgi:hypothetical protein